LNLMQRTTVFFSYFWFSHRPADGEAHA